MNIYKAGIALAISTVFFSFQASAEDAHTARDLTDQYYNTTQNCGTNNRPSFLCSGVMLRGTVPSTQYHSWDPSPSSVQSGGTSFSYLRKDTKFNKLAYGYKNGLMFYPQNKTPDDLLKIEVLCSFPIDADTFQRSDKGCGAHKSYLTTSKPCQSMGIQTAEQWDKHYKSSSKNAHQHQCGFDVKKSVKGNAKYFYASVKARSLIATEAFREQNETRLATWEKGIPSQLPIQAFFYVNGLSGGLNNAQFDQRDYYKETGNFIPIIKLTLPAKNTDNAKFNYISKDQVIDPTDNDDDSDDTNNNQTANTNVTNSAQAVNPTV